MTSAPPGIVRTVLGDVAPHALGHTQPHEHLLCDVRPPLAGGEEDELPGAITLENVYDVRRHHPRFELLLDDRKAAIDEMHAYRQAGGGTVVDASNPDIGRDPEGLAEISRATGVHIVMGCGNYVAAFHDSTFRDLTTADITTDIIGDVTDGVTVVDSVEPRIRAGVIGEIGLSHPIHPDELRALVAASRAQHETGAGLLVHPGRHPLAPIEAVELAIEAGADPARIIVCHLDRTLFDVDSLVRLADTGVYLEFDQFGQESSFYSHQPFTVAIPNDATRIQLLVSLRDRGYLNQLLIAQDICHLSSFVRWGGEGFAHILTRVLPLMAASGFSDQEITRITHANPARALAINS